MRLKESFNISGMEYNLGPFYKSDIKTILKMSDHYPKLFDDSAEDKKELLVKCLYADNTLYSVMRKRDKVFGFAILNPMLYKQGYTHFWRIPDSRSTFDDMYWGINVFLFYIFTHYDLHRVTQIVLRENKAAIRLAETVGCSLEGIIREAMFYDGKAEDAVLYGILKEEVLLCQQSQ